LETRIPRLFTKKNEKRVKELAEASLVGWGTRNRSEELRSNQHHREEWGLQISTNENGFVHLRSSEPVSSQGRGYVPNKWLQCIA
jgi:hypothetical protein